MDSRDTFMRMWLPREWVPFEVIEKLHGISKVDLLGWGGFKAWSQRLRRPREVMRPNEVNRHEFESYLQHSWLLPMKAAAVRLGMTAESFQDTLAVLDESDTIILNTRDFPPQVVNESLIRHFHEPFPDLQNRIFGDHNDYCSRLHQAISKDLDIEVAPLYCETSQHLRQDPVDYAYDYDCFTDSPIGLRYQVWLDFKKPINLRPDACSLKFYIEHEAELKPLVFAGHEPEIPEGFRRG